MLLFQGSKHGKHGLKPVTGAMMAWFMFLPASVCAPELVRCRKNHNVLRRPEYASCIYWRSSAVFMICFAYCCAIIMFIFLVVRRSGQWEMERGRFLRFLWFESPFGSVAEKLRSLASAEVHRLGVLENFSLKLCTG